MQSYETISADFNNPDNWIDNGLKTTCSSCGRTFSIIYKGKTNNKITCPRCISRYYNSDDKSNKILIDKIINDIDKVVDDPKLVFERLIILAHLGEMRYHVYYHDDYDSDKLKNIIDKSIGFLGFTGNHPAAKFVRSEAVDIISDYVDYIKDNFIENLPKDPWQCYANMVIVLSHNPKSNEFKALYLTAACSLNMQLRNFVTTNVTITQIKDFKKVIELVDGLLSNAEYKDLKFDYHFFKSFLDIFDDFKTEDLGKLVTKLMPETFGLYNFYPNGDADVKKIFKIERGFLVTAFLHSPEKMGKWLSSYGEPMRKMIEFFAATGKAICTSELESYFGIKYNLSISGKSWDATVRSEEPTFPFFDFEIVRINYNTNIIFMRLKNSIADILKRVGLIPASYGLCGHSENEIIPGNSDNAVFCDNGAFYSNINIIREFYKNGYIETAKAGNKILKATYKNFTEVTGLGNFFNNANLSELRPGLVMWAFHFANADNLYGDLRSCLNELLTYRAKDFDFGDIFLPHISKIDKTAVARCFSFVKSLLKRSTGLEWISFNSVLTLFQDECKQIIIDMLDKNVLFRRGQFDYYAMSTEVDDFYAVSHYFEPLIKGILHLYAALGLVDFIASNIDTEKIRFVTPTPYCRLDYFRVSELGQQFLDDGAIVPDAAPVVECKLILDEQKLLLHIENSNKMIENLVLKISDPAGENLYSVSYESFFRKIKTKDDFNLVMDQIKRLLPADMPDVWKIFFKQMDRRVTPLTETGEFIVLKVKDSPELRTVILSDPYLKSAILKAEGFHFLIKKSEYTKVAEAISKRGFII